jgi:hypothetical protein
MQNFVCRSGGYGGYGGGFTAPTPGKHLISSFPKSEVFPYVKRLVFPRIPRIPRIPRRIARVRIFRKSGSERTRQ